MNAQRRKEIDKLLDQAQAIADALDTMQQEESDDDAQGMLETAADSIDSAMDSMREAADVGKA